VGEVPQAAEYWKEDRFCGSQFLNGCNPDSLKRCTKLPPHFPVTQELVGNLLDSGDTLESAMAVGFGNVSKSFDVKHGKLYARLRPLFLFTKASNLKVRVKVGIQQKAVFWLVMVLTQISPSGFKQSKISSSHITTFRAFFENVLVSFGYIWDKQFFSKDE